ncbi:MAG: PIG-L family deacetylase [Acidobacteriota bacterium]|nr:MAG: PIG-L family deacetylase [Acidobacteriota bacterium]
MKFARPTVFFTVLILFILFFPISSLSQVRPIYDQGAVGLGQMLKRIGNTKRIMHIGAHPDDEDSDLLAYLARKENARVVYLSLTRGDGGQNVIGPELFEALGVIRTEELLQARTLDGAEQMFTRAFDYGFSKTLEEAKRFWDEEKIKCDIVRAIRSFRPQVVNPRFSGTPADGHGQHQFAGYITPIAVKAAADPNECPGTGAPWKVQKLYVGQSFRLNAEPSLSMNTGLYDHLIGKSYYEIAAYGRSQHKSQEQGGLELRGDRFSGVNLVESSVETPAKETSMFDGVDVSLESIFTGPSGSPGSDGPGSAAIEKFERLLQDTTLFETSETIYSLLKLREELMRILAASSGPVDALQYNIAVNDKLQEVGVAIRKASGLQIDALAEQETVTAGESFGVNVNLFFPEDSGLSMRSVKLKAPKGWQVEPADPEASEGGPARFRENPRAGESFKATVPADAKLTQPYFLEKPRDGYLYQVADEADPTQPFQPALITALVTMDVKGTEITFEQPVEYRFADDTRGELRRNLNVVPAVSVGVDQGLLAVPRTGREERRQIAININGNAADGIDGTAKLVVPNGWRSSCENASFAKLKKGGSTSVDCTVTIPANASAGDYAVRAEVAANGKTFSKTMNTIAYEHIQTHRYYTDAETKVFLLDLKALSVKVGYVPGSGDYAPEAMRQMGLEVEELGKKELTSGDLSKYDTIVIGIRASEVNPDYVANNGRLLDYTRAGGTMIVQYQKFPYQTLNLAPYPVQFNARVSEEDAKVTILEPQHPVFTTPNKITQADFEGWVQERNLYAFRSFDERYTPLLESHDTGEPENNGGMVYAKVGEGQFVYTSYAFFRQLPAGVPGAWRLFANIVSLGEER